MQTAPAGTPTGGTVYFTDAYAGGSPIGVTQTADPLLGPLQYNGGLTPTMAPAYNSPVIDAAYANLSPTLDQRGVARPQGAGPDNGAVEFVTTLRVAVIGIKATRVSANAVSITFTLLNSGNVPATNVKVANARLRLLASTSLPAAFTLAPGGTQSVTLTFTSGTAIPAGTTPFVMSGSYTGGTFSSGSNIAVP